MSSISYHEKVILVFDHHGLAFDNVATALKTRLSVTSICWNDYLSIQGIVRYLALQRPKIVHFFWRDHLRLFLEELIRKDVVDDFSSTHFTFSIPDHLRKESASLAQFAILPLRASSFVVTNNALLKSYRELELLGSPWGVIHDFSENSRVNQKVEKDFSGHLRALWVGNSKWGESLGVPDHKGLRKIINAVLDKDFQARYSIELVTCDSSRYKLSHQELRELYMSCHLIFQASNSEGTGLPLLEGMAHGCVPLTTEVGVVPELFSEVLRQFCIADRDPIRFRDQLIQLISDRKRMAQLSVESQERVRLFYSDFPESRWVEFFKMVAASEVPVGLSVSRDPSKLIREKRVSLRRFPLILQFFKAIRGRIRTLGALLKSH